MRYEDCGAYDGLKSLELGFRRFSIGPPCLGFRLVVWRGGLGRFPGGPYGKELFNCYRLIREKKKRTCALGYFSLASPF